MHAALNSAAVSYFAVIKPGTLTQGYNQVMGIETATHNPFCNFLIKSTLKLAPYVNATGTVDYDGTGANTLVAGTTYSVAMTYSAAAGLVGYVNGFSDGTAVANGDVATISGHFLLGNGGTANRHWLGNISMLYACNQVLTALEVAALHANPMLPYLRNFAPGLMGSAE